MLSIKWTITLGFHISMDFTVYFLDFYCIFPWIVLYISMDFWQSWTHPLCNTFRWEICFAVLDAIWDFDSPMIFSVYSLPTNCPQAHTKIQRILIAHTFIHSLHTIIHKWYVQSYSLTYSVFFKSNSSQRNTHTAFLIALFRPDLNILLIVAYIMSKMMISILY